MITRKELYRAVMQRAWALARKVSILTEHLDLLIVKPRHFIGWALTKVWEEVRALGWVLDTNWRNKG